MSSTDSTDLHRFTPGSDRAEFRDQKPEFRVVGEEKEGLSADFADSADGSDEERRSSIDSTDLHRFRGKVEVEAKVEAAVEAEVEGKRSLWFIVSGL